MRITNNKYVCELQLSENIRNGEESSGITRIYIMYF